jgi:hypothetical protein
LAERDHLADASDGEPGFGGSRFVVEPGVQYSAVVARLMTPNAIFFFEDDHFGIGESFSETEGGGEADDASADNDYLFGFHSFILSTLERARRLSKDLFSPNQGSR